MEKNKQHVLTAKKNRRVLVEDFNKSVAENEKKATSTNKVPERAEPSGKRMKGDFASFCCPMAFGATSTCMFAWFKGCKDEIDDKREVRSEKGGE